MLVRVKILKVAVNLETQIATKILGGCESWFRYVISRSWGTSHGKLHPTTVLLGVP